MCPNFFCVWCFEWSSQGRAEEWVCTVYWPFFSVFLLMHWHQHCCREGGAWLLCFDSDSTKRGALGREGGAEDCLGRSEERREQLDFPTRSQLSGRREEEEGLRCSSVETSSNMYCGFELYFCKRTDSCWIAPVELSKPSTVVYWITPMELSKPSTVHIVIHQLAQILKQWIFLLCERNDWCGESFLYVKEMSGWIMGEFSFEPIWQQGMMKRKKAKKNQKKLSIVNMIWNSGTIYSWKTMPNPKLY